MMAQEMRRNSYGESIFEAVDLDENGPRYRSYGSPPPTASRDGYFPDDPMPIFLSGEADASAPPYEDKTRDGSAVWSRILKFSILAASTAAIGFTFLSVDNPLALFANAKASLAATSASQLGAPWTPSVRTVAVPPAAAAPPAVPAVTAPSRDEIAAALKAAHEVEVRTPPAAAPPARRLDADEIAALLKRAKSLIAIGDIAAARLLLERAADAQEAGAALLLAQTYDPAVLGTPDARSITPDPATARDWYQKAAQFGSLQAQQRLKQMQN
jgi:hypothetical protein